MMFFGKQALQHKLDVFTARMHRRAEQFRRSGACSAASLAELCEIQRHGDALKERVSQTEEGGVRWELATSEILREFSTLEDDLDRIEDELDAKPRMQS